MCKRQTSVSHSSTESEILSLDAGLRMDGLPALELWDIVIQVLRSPRAKCKIPKVQPTHQDEKAHPNACGNMGKHNVGGLLRVDHVPSSAQSCQRSSKLYIFEDNEAVIKMIMKGRSPTMRHVTRTHRVALDWLFDRINFDPKIQIRYVDTKNQLADILTKGSFSKDEWNNLIRLLNIMNVSTFSQSHSSHFVSDFLPKAETNFEERTGAKCWRRFGNGETEANESCTRKNQNFGGPSIECVESLGHKKCL